MVSTVYGLIKHKVIAAILKLINIFVLNFDIIINYITNLNISFLNEAVYVNM